MSRGYMPLKCNLKITAVKKGLWEPLTGANTWLPQYSDCAPTPIL